MRGIVMILMALDHASEAFNKGRLFTDSFALYTAGTKLPALQFFTRWITHICAPTFLFLAGTSLALSSERREKAGEPRGSLDRFLLTRGLLIAALDLVLISPLWGQGSITLQVLYAIGMSFVFMIPLRRLKTAWLFGLSVAFILGGELLTGVLFTFDIRPLSVIGALLIHGGVFPHLMVPYPVFPWLAVMMLGFAFGRGLIAARDDHSVRWSPERLLLVGGAALLVVFGVVRGVNGYGNMLLPRDDCSLIQWLHVSKYPPSLSFYSLELGLMGIVLGLLFRIEKRGGTQARLRNPILVFGQTAFFFYVLHIVILELSARALHLHMKMGLGAAYVATAAVLLFLYPCCLWYRGYKASHPGGWARFV